MGLSAKFFSALLPKLHFASSVNHSDVFSEQFSLLAPFRYLSNKRLVFWNKNFETIFKLPSTCTDEYIEVKMVFEENVSFFLLLDFRQNTTHFRRMKSSARFSELTFTWTEGHFEGIRLSNKTKILWIFLWLEYPIFWILRQLLVRLSKPHSICTIDQFVVNQFSVKKNFIFYQFRIEGQKILDFLWSFFCIVVKTAFCVSF